VGTLVGGVKRTGHAPSQPFADETRNLTRVLTLPVKVIGTGEFELRSLYPINRIELRARIFRVLQRKTAGFSARAGRIASARAGFHHPVIELTRSRSTPDTSDT
jgi:hypothetical protein